LRAPKGKEKLDRREKWPKKLGRGGGEKCGGK